MDLEKARKAALHLLSTRMYTCREIYERLLTKGCDADTANISSVIP